MKPLISSQHYRIKFEGFKGPLNWAPLCRDTPITHAANDFFFQSGCHGGNEDIGAIMMAYYLKKIYFYAQLNDIFVLLTCISEITFVISYSSR